MMEFFRGCGALTLVMAYKCETKSFAMISLWPIDRSTAANEQYRRIREIGRDLRFRRT